MKKKRLTDNQSELVAAFLPQKLQRNKKLSTSVKLVLANIYQLYYYDNNYGKRTVYRTREDFMKDIDAKDKNEVLRPHAVLMQNDMVYIRTGVRGRATEYTLNDDLYAMLPKQIRGEVSEKFAETLNCNSLSNSSLQIEDDEVISPLHNELSHSELQHLNVPSESDAETDIEKISMYTDHEADVTNEQVKLSKDELNQRNEYISAVYGKLDDRLNYLYSLNTVTQYEDVCSGIVEVISDAQEHRDWFTEPQWDKMTRYSDRFVKLNEAKDKYFNGKNTKIYVDESSSIEEEKASAHEPSADEDELISTVVNDSVGYVDAKVTSTDEETTPEDDLTSVDSSKGDLNLTDRLTYPQFGDKNPPQVAPLPPFTEEFNRQVRSAIRKGVYDWSLTLTEIPDYITGDDYTQIVGDALRAQPDHESHLGKISLSELSGFAKELMENRLHNKDIPAIVRENQYKKRHEAFRKELNA